MPGKAANHPFSSLIHPNAGFFAGGIPHLSIAYHTMATVSVIIPAFNAADYLRQSLESVASQSFADIEVIVIDDGSTDDTPRIAEEFSRRDPRFTLISRPNGGIASARNAGIDISSGRYISFVDADDMLFPDSISLLLSGIESRGCRMAAGTFTRSLTPRLSRRGQWRELDSREALADLLYQRTLDSGPWGKLFDRSLFSDLRFREGIIYEDLDLIYRLIEKAGKVAVTKDVVYYYRPNPRGLMHTFNLSRLDVLDVTRRIEEHYRKKSDPLLLRAARDRRLSANFNMLGLMAANGDPDTREVAEECMKLIKSYRRESLTDPHVRLKNKIGILLSYGGRRLFQRVAALYYR